MPEPKRQEPDIPSKQPDIVPDPKPVEVPVQEPPQKEAPLRM
jgi:hypothetical protein